MRIKSILAAATFSLALAACGSNGLSGSPADNDGPVSDNYLEEQMSLQEQFDATVSRCQKAVLEKDGWVKLNNVDLFKVAQTIIGEDTEALQGYSIHHGADYPFMAASKCSTEMYAFAQGGEPPKGLAQ